MLERTRKYNFIRLEACNYKIEGPEKRQNQEDTIYWFRGKINIRQHFLVTFLEIEEKKRIIQTVGDIERELLVWVEGSGSAWNCVKQGGSTLVQWN